MLWNKLKILQNRLKGLNNHLALYSQKLQQARLNLEITQTKLIDKPVCSNLIEQEKAWLIEVKKWSDIVEQVYRQKDRVTWIDGGDANTRYFHAKLKIRTSKNTITSIYHNTGVKLEDPALVKAEFIKFFSNFMGAQLPCPSITVIRSGVCLSHEQKHNLITSITELKIHALKKGMPHDKAPGVKHQLKQELLKELGYSEGELSFRYLGVPLSSKKLIIG
ncbi:uncharacterized protein LOC107876638 [Capsicum annuum]|uniref:uncharacterized protein LOC107876638 n=1 Tax=Capsicum annuum TaxID=4072 RepID=UPI0007BEAE2B|nr:uncharacterized protein LOC107876638 [Capsicum annuum]